MDIINSDIFDASSKSLLSLFNSAESLFQVPVYQRPYRWTKTEVDELWNDIYEAFTNNKEDAKQDINYFLGSIITVPDKKTGYKDIVDGQQRITTLMIMFNMIFKIFPNLNEDSENANAITNKMVGKCIRNDNDRERLRLQTHPNYQSDFKREVLDADIETILQFEVPKKYEDDPKLLFKNTANIFAEYFTKMNIEEANQFVEYLFNKVKIINIECTDESFAIKMFQIINNRGLDLFSSDLIKSSLFKQIDNEHDKTVFLTDWNDIEKGIKDLQDVNIDEMFTLYQYFCIEENPKLSLDKVMINYFVSHDISPNDAVADFKEFVEKYRKDIEQTDNKIIYSLRYIPWKMYWRTIVLTAEMTNYPEKEKLYKSIFRFYYLFWIAGETMTKIKQTSFNVIRNIKEKKSLQNIDQELENMLEKHRIKKLALEHLNSENVYSRRWAKPLILSIEYNQTGENHSTFISLPSVQLDHILPQKYVESDWNIDKKTATRYMNTIGNLTLLSGARNIKARNDKYAIKLQIYNGQGRHKDCKDGCTAYRISQQIVDNYKEDWSEETIKKRWNWMCDEIKNLLSLDTSSIKQNLN